MKKIVNVIQEGGVLPDKIKAANPGLQNLEQNHRILLPIAQRQEQSGIIV